MSDGVTVEFQVHFGRGRFGRREAREGAEPVAAPVGNVPRVSRLMALAIKCDELIRSGEVSDYAELARVGHVTRARMSQIMNLLNLAPDIQEAILFLPRTLTGRDPLRLADLQPVAAQPDWRIQRQLWQQLSASFAESR